MSASSFGMQPFKIKVISDKETKEKLKEATFNREQIPTSSHILVFCIYTNYKDKLESYAKIMKDKNIPEDKIEAKKNSFIKFLNRKTEDELFIWAQKQVYIALGNAINGAKEIGYDSCPIEGFIPSEYSRILNLDDNTIPTIVVPIGIAADIPREKIRFSNEELFF